jgi:F0F1-type ATP synthase assembly protein I
MSPNQPISETDVKRAINAYSVSIASVGAQVGILTVLVIFVALFIGLWLDNTFHSKPTFTMLMVLGSIPVTLGLMFWVVKKATRRILASSEQKAAQEKDQSFIDKE